MPAVDEAGRVYRRCACRSEKTGRQLGARCPRRTEPGHGRWYFAVMVAGVDGRRVRVRRGGFATRAAAVGVLAVRARWPVASDDGGQLPVDRVPVSDPVARRAAVGQAAYPAGAA